MESLSEITYEIIKEYEKGSLPNAILFWERDFLLKKQLQLNLQKES